MSGWEDKNNVGMERQTRHHLWQANGSVSITAAETRFVNGSVIFRNICDMRQLKLCNFTGMITR